MPKPFTTFSPTEYITAESDYCPFLDDHYLTHYDVSDLWVDFYLTSTSSYGEATACADASNAAQEFGGLTDDAISNAYGATPLYDAGDFAQSQTIAIFELEQFLPSDIETFDSCYFGTAESRSSRCCAGLGTSARGMGTAGSDWR